MNVTKLLPVTLSFGSESTTARACRRVRHAREPIRRNRRNTDNNVSVDVLRHVDNRLPVPVADDHRAVRLANDRDDPLLAG